MGEERIRARVSHAASRGLALFLLVTGCIGAQAPHVSEDPTSPRAWADEAARNQAVQIETDVKPMLRYQARKVDNKEDLLREVVECPEGSVARILARNGSPLDAQADAAERDRLNDLLNSPEALRRHTERARTARGYAAGLMRLMPEAMLWTFVPGQPQIPAAVGPQVVLDFHPDPKFKPPTLASEGLTGVAGRVWIDRRTRHVVRIEANIIHPVNFGWGGILARVREGGTISYEQHPLGENRWFYAEVDQHFTIREALIHTVEENTRLQTSNVQPIPPSTTCTDAIHFLLAMPVPVR